MSSGTATELVVVVPPGFSVGDLAPPDLSQSPQLALEQWGAARGASGDALAWACIAGDASSWNGDADDIAQGKLAELASSTAARMCGAPTPMHVTSSAHGGLERSLAADDGLAVARTFVAFTPARAHGCFVACTQRAGCGDAVATAHVTGALVSAPPAGFVLRALSLAVHHPHGALAGFGGILVVAAALAVATRPGKRRKRSFPRLS